MMPLDWTPHPWHWWALGVALGLLELLVPGVGLLWLGVAALLVCTVLFLAPAFALAGQAVLFAVLAGVLLVATRRLLAKPRDEAGAERLNSRTAHYIGRVLVLESALANGQGRARLDDGVWPVTGPQDLPAGARVRVVGVDGTVLRVEAA